MCFVADVAVSIVKTNDGVRPIGVFGTIHSAAGEKGCQLRNGDAEELISENVFQALLPVWEVSFQPLVEPFGNLPQKDAALAAGVQKGNGRIGKSSCGSRSSMALAISGGVNTSSLERLARQLNTSGLWMLLFMIPLPAVCGNPWGTHVPGIWVRIPEEVPLPPVPGSPGVLITQEFILPEVPAFDEGAAHGGPFGKEDRLLSILGGSIYFFMLRALPLRMLRSRTKWTVFWHSAEGGRFKRRSYSASHRVCRRSRQARTLSASSSTP